MLELISVSKSFGAQHLFSNVNLRIGPQDRVGLVGQNGTGKTTLFRIMVSEVSPDHGTVEKKKGIRIGYLKQEVSPRNSSNDSMLDYCIKESRGIGKLLEERERLLKMVEGGDEEHLLRLSEVDEELHLLGADTIASEAKAVLMGLGFKEEELNRPMNTLSGGLLMRVELARILLSQPDILLLDEPTNHLDLEGILWFEEYLSSFKGAYVMVAHDREFLNRTVTRIVEVSNRGVIEYGGNSNLPIYDRYIEEREKAIRLAWKRYEEQQARIAEIEDFIARNRVRKDRAQVVQSRIRMLEKMERLEPPEQIKNIHFSFPQPSRGPDTVIELENISKRYGDKVVFKDLSLRIHRGEHIALVGVNGAGKSTLLKIVAGVIQPSGGRRLLGEKVTIGYFAQDQYEILDPNKTVYEEMMEVADAETAPHVRSMLGAFLFKEDDIDKKVASLSGGEKARLMLARLLIRPCILLVLDEPTNHLDIASREVLERALKDYKGAVVFTSHDRRFMDVIAQAVLEMKDGKLTRFEGNYSYYVSKTGSPKPIQITRETKGITKRDLEKARKREEAEQRNRIYRLLKPLKEKVALYEARIESLEKELRGLEEKMVSKDFYRDIGTALAVTQRAKEIRAELDKAYEDWTKAVDELERMESR